MTLSFLTISPPVSINSTSCKDWNICDVHETVFTWATNKFSSGLQETNSLTRAATKRNLSRITCILWIHHITWKCNNRYRIKGWWSDRTRTGFRVLQICFKHCSSDTLPSTSTWCKTSQIRKTSQICFKKDIVLHVSLVMILWCDCLSCHL